MWIHCGYIEMQVSLSHIFGVKIYYPGDADVELKLFVPCHY